MSTEIKLPELGENLPGGNVLDVKVAEGDSVTEGQSLMEVEAEKSTIDVPASQAGRITKILVKRGDQIKVGQTIAVIEGDGASTPQTETAPAKTQERSGEPEPRAAASTPPQEPQANKQEVADRVQEVHRPVEGRPAAARTAPPPPTPTAQPAGKDKLVPAGPATRRLARELGIDLAQVPGSALGGRVTQEDVKAYVRQLAEGVAPMALAGGPIQAPPLPDFSKWGPVEVKPLEGIRRKTAEQMALAWSLIPHVTQHDLADITDLEAFRKQQEKAGPKLTVTAFAIKAAASALKQFPQFNASIDLARGQLVFKQYYHVGVAVDTDRGLLVPVLRDVDRKGVRELGQELNEMADRARQRKLPIEEMRGGTFTITNLGGIGGTGFTPIVNWPEVAILGMSRARLQPVVRNGEIVPRLILPLSLSYDHRVIDGADAARFTRRIAEMLENPLLILL